MIWASQQIFHLMLLGKSKCINIDSYTAHSLWDCVWWTSCDCSAVQKLWPSAPDKLLKLTDHLIWSDDLIILKWKWSTMLCSMHRMHWLSKLIFTTLLLLLLLLQSTLFSLCWCCSVGSRSVCLSAAEWIQLKYYKYLFPTGICCPESCWCDPVWLLAADELSNSNSQTWSAYQVLLCLIRNSRRLCGWEDKYSLWWNESDRCSVDNWEEWPRNGADNI